LAVGEILAGVYNFWPGPCWVRCWPVTGHPVHAETQKSLQLLGKLGLILLLFQVGMEFDYGHLRSRSRTVTRRSLMGLLALFLCGLAMDPGCTGISRRTCRPSASNSPVHRLSISALPIMDAFFSK